MPVVDAIKEVFTKDFMAHKVIDVILGFISDLGAEKVGRMLFGDFKDTDRQLLEQAVTLAKNGKREEAWKMIEPRLQASPSGAGPYDEAILYEDLLSLFRLPAAFPHRPTDAEIIALARYLRGLPEHVRESHRIYQTIEPNRAVRRQNLLQLARLPNDDARNDVIGAAGAFERGTAGQIDDAVEQAHVWLDQFSPRIPAAVPAAGTPWWRTIMALGWTALTTRLRIIVGAIVVLIALVAVWAIFSNFQALIVAIVVLSALYGLYRGFTH